MNSAHTLTVVLITLLILAVWLVSYDVYLVQRFGVGATISWRTLQFCRQNRITCAFAGLFLGILSAHLLTLRDRPLWSSCQPVLAFYLAMITGAVFGLLYWVQRGPSQ